jgi:hypothetical protein
MMVVERDELRWAFFSDEAVDRRRVPSCSSGYDLGRGQSYADQATLGHRGERAPRYYVKPITGELLFQIDPPRRAHIGQAGRDPGLGGAMTHTS